MRNPITGDPEVADPSFQGLKSRIESLAKEQVVNLTERGALSPGIIIRPSTLVVRTTGNDYKIRLCARVGIATGGGSRLPIRADFVWWLPDPRPVRSGNSTSAQGGRRRPLKAL
jgi:hypothetical protein